MTASFVILTGALGSGKTTLLSTYLALPQAADTGVIVNDAGEINVDGAIIESGRRDLPFARLGNGCVCCSAGAELGDAIDELIALRAERGLGDPRQIILETSGLAEPGPIVRSLTRSRRYRFNLRIVATFDCDRGDFGDDGLPQYAAQLAGANAVVLTKLDRCSRESRGAKQEEVRRFNPLAAQVVVADAADRAIAAFGGGETVDPGHPALRVGPRCHPRLTILTARWGVPPAWHMVEDWLDDIAAFCGARLLRVKGMISPADMPGPLLINAVGDCFGPPTLLRGGARAAQDGLVLIVRDLGLPDLATFSRMVSACPPVLTEPGSTR